MFCLSLCPKGRQDYVFYSGYYTRKRWGEGFEHGAIDIKKIFFFVFY